MATFARVQAGQKLKISASTYNAMLTATEAYQSNGFNTGAGVASGGQAQTVLVKNTSGSDTLQFDVLGVSGVVFSPTDAVALKQFKNSIILRGTVPSISSHEGGRFVVCAEAIPTGKIGRAHIAGVCQVKINVIAEHHQFADVKDGDHALLNSAMSGAVSIIWKESGTGTKWAIVRLGDSGGTVIRRAICKANAGSDNFIHVNLFDSRGVEITEGTEEVDYHIPVYCNISGGTALNAAIPRLEVDDEISVYQAVDDNGGDPEKFWQAIEHFQGSIDCACAE